MTMLLVLTTRLDKSLPGGKEATMIDNTDDVEAQPDKPLPWRERGETAAVGATIAASHDAAVSNTSLLKLEHCGVLI